MKQETKGYVTNVINLICTIAIIYFSVFHVEAQSKLDEKASIVYVDSKNDIQDECMTNNKSNIEANKVTIKENYVTIDTKIDRIYQFIMKTQNK